MIKAELTGLKTRPTIFKYVAWSSDNRNQSHSVVFFLLFCKLCGGCYYPKIPLCNAKVNPPF